MPIEPAQSPTVFSSPELPKPDRLVIGPGKSVPTVNGQRHSIHRAIVVDAQQLVSKSDIPQADSPILTTGESQQTVTRHGNGIDAPDVSLELARETHGVTSRIAFAGKGGAVATAAYIWCWELLVRFRRRA